MPGEITDRAEEAWEPLVAIADMAGGDWPARARSAAVALGTGAPEDGAESIGVRLALGRRGEPAGGRPIVHLRRDAANETGSRRTIDIVEPLREDLEAFRVHGHGTVDSDLVAPNRQGKPLDLRTWRRRIWKPAAERAGVEASPYDLRHAYCSLLAHEGRSAPYIAAMMGHSLTDNQRHYAHLIDDARLATGTSMVAAVRAARAKVKVRPRYAQPRQRHLQAVAESA
jgi:hypothetical protein